MSTELNHELREWAADWRSDERQRPALEESVRRRIRQGSRRQVAYTVFEAAIAAAAVVFVARQALRNPEAWNVVAMATLALLAVTAMAFSVWNRTGTWKPSAQSTSAFIDLLTLRLGRRLRGLRAGLVLLGLEAAVLAPWLWLLLADRAERSGLPLTAVRYAGWFGLLAAWIGAFALVCLWLIRRTRRQLAQLEAVRQGLVEPGETL